MVTIVDHGKTHAIVMGGSMAGLLAARVLADHFAQVTLLERDLLPHGVAQRRGVPQGQYTHGLWWVADKHSTGCSLASHASWPSWARCPAEWDSFLFAPDDVLARIDQMAAEFHGVQDDKYQAVVQRLKAFFHIAHIHFNNAACVSGLDSFPTWAYEVLFVSTCLSGCFNKPPDIA